VKAEGTDMKFKKCGCHVIYLERISRQTWMKILLPERRLYACACCHSVQLVKKSHVDSSRDALESGGKGFWLPDADA
jgi:hypothetical protein